MSFYEQAQDSADISLGLKVQVFGGTQTGKSHDGYENLPRPMIVVDSDSTADKFKDEERFENFKRLGLDTVPDLPTLIAFLEEFVTDPRWYREYKAVLVDSLTVLVDRTIASLKIDMSSQAQDRGRGQADFARLAKELNRLIRHISGLGIHVYVVAEERTRFDGSQPAKGPDQGESSLSPTKFRYPFDLILQKTSKSEVVVRKSRYAKWKEGERVSGFDARRDLGPILSGDEQKTRGLEHFDPVTNAHEELMALLKEYGSTARGGRIPAEEMRGYLKTAHDNDLPDAEVRRAMNEVRKKYGSPAKSAA